MLVYHRTVAAEAILEGGFRDASGTYMISGHTLTGVWVGDGIHDVQDGVLGDDVLEIEIDSSLLDPFEVEDLSGKQFFREWCVPASILNQHARLRLLAEHEEEEVATRGLTPIARDDPRLEIDPAVLARMRQPPRADEDSDE